MFSVDSLLQDRRSFNLSSTFFWVFKIRTSLRTYTLGPLSVKILTSCFELVLYKKCTLLGLYSFYLTCVFHTLSVCTLGWVIPVTHLRFTSVETSSWGFVLYLGVFSVLLRSVDREIHYDFLLFDLLYCSVQPTYPTL